MFAKILAFKCFRDRIYLDTNTQVCAVEGYSDSCLELTLDPIWDADRHHQRANPNTL
ncbi:hypothetical protein S7335_2071 [Synechococcus sp. PCC 7335]|nr:hypothetical protein S7335_2071 [Synechococcus sp. PCC 7335]